MEGPTLRRPWRGWISILASGSVLAVALALMTIADAGHPGAHPERVVSTVGPRPQVDQPGGGTAIPARGARPRRRVRRRPPTRLPVTERQPFSPGDPPRIQVQLALSVAPVARVAAGRRFRQVGASAALPTSAAVRCAPARVGEPRDRDPDDERDDESQDVQRDHSVTVTVARTGDHASACRSSARTGPMSNGGPSMTITCSACASR